MVIFWSIGSSKNDQKWTRAKKVEILKKSFPSCPSTSQRNLCTLLMPWLNFYDQFLKLWAVILERRNIFSKFSFAKITFFVGTLVGLMWSWIKKNWMTSTVRIFLVFTQKSFQLLRSMFFFYFFGIKYRSSMIESASLKKIRI